MNPTEAYDLRESAQFLDVREWYEWDSGHVEGSIHMPLRTLAQRFDMLDDSKPVVVVCQIGQRSALAAQWLRARGYDAHNLEGGVEAWVADGHPLVGGGGSAGKIVDGWAQTLPET